MNLRQNKSYVSASTMKVSVQVFKPTISAANDEFQRDTSYALESTVWGDWRPDGNDRVLDDLRLTYRNVGRLFIHYTVTINNFYQIEVNGLRYTIHSINDVGNQHQYWEIILKADAIVTA